MKNNINFITLYCTLCAISTFVNIVFQDISLRIYTYYGTIMVSVLVGTAAGFIIKYMLDKKYIFHFKAKNLAQDSKTFSMYAFMGIFTTIIFWCTEFLFEYLYKTKEMRYLGAVIGLSIGYFIKYHLDKRFVFKQN